MDENAEKRQQEINAAFTAVAATLEDIQINFTEAHTEIQSLITTLQETELANHAETLSTLTILETKMTETASQNLSHITDSLQILDDKFDISLENINSKMTQNFHALKSDIISHLTQQDTNMIDHFDLLNDYLTNNFTTISNTIINNGSNQQVYLDDLQNLLLNKLNDVFTYVSNGKKKCTSALITKGITIDMVTIHNYIPYDSCSFILSHDFKVNSLYELLMSNQETQIANTKTIVSAASATSEDINLLDVLTSSSMLCFHTVSTTKSGIIVDYAFSRYRGDLNKFEINDSPLKV